MRHCSRVEIGCGSAAIDVMPYHESTSPKAKYMRQLANPSGQGRHAARPYESAERETHSHVIQRIALFAAQ
jgi:hypothetical protein